MDAVWLVRSRQLMRRMRFWIMIVGYDPGDRSITHRIYLLYVVIFFSLWGFVVLALFADQVAFILSWLVRASPVRSAIVFTTIILLVDFLFQCYRYAKRSPFVFSEDDAGLICLTPVDRRQVALAWLLGEWIPAGLPYWALAVTLSFSILQLTYPAGLIAANLPLYLLAALRAVSVMLPLHLALMTFTYIFGVIRLRGEKDLPYLRLIPLGVGAILLLLSRYDPAFLRIFLWPLIYPLQAGFGIAHWLAGFALVFLLALLSLLLLYLVTPRLNLSRASQESQHRWEFKPTRSVRGTE